MRQRTSYKALTAFLFLASLFSAQGAYASGEANAKALYDRWCVQCHGPTGKGDGVNSTPDMSINPRNHTDPNFMSTRTDDQFEEVITEGGAGIAKSPLMPMWKRTLTPPEIRALVRYLRELCNCSYEGVVSNKKLRKVDTSFK